MAFAQLKLIGAGPDGGGPVAGGLGAGPLGSPGTDPQGESPAVAQKPLTNPGTRPVVD